LKGEQRGLRSQGIVLADGVMTVGWAAYCVKSLVSSASFKLALEDCLDATFRVFLEDLHRTMFVKKTVGGVTESVSTSVVIASIGTSADHIPC